ncbi:hypothetical protein SELMODRAFT_235703 [Selaginella moellendorffii]|uniref:Tubulin/FtsZ GTPase domain-containing protein n=1 Tax=Selaginella moellendorffii TaxID=88036 RepID=D8T0J9_SELML|nr:hypothetical protein SELMODRAFT_235703 [Selaginella moellendorffii]
MPTDRISGRDDAFNTFFSETGAGKHVPRSLFLDLEPTVIEVRTGTYSQLFHPEQLISGKEDAARSLQTIEGFLIFNAVGLRSASRLTTARSRSLALRSSRRLYVPSTHSLLEHTDVGHLRQLRHHLHQPQQARATGMLVISSLTTLLRFDGARHYRVPDQLGALSPDSSSYAPVISAEKAYDEQLSVSEITMRPVTASTWPAASCTDVTWSLRTTIKTHQVVDWCPTGVKSGINYQPLTVVPGGESKEPSA